MIKDPYAALAYTKDKLALLPTDQPWLVPQSGGKDSRTVAWAILILLKEREIKPPERLVFYMADTLLEYPTFLQQAKKALTEQVLFARSLGIKATSFMTVPRLHDDFFVRILGMGLIPPTGAMRWCTDKMKIVPPRDVLQKQ